MKIKFPFWFQSVFEHCKDIPYPKRECIPEEESDHDKEAQKNQQQQQQHQQHLQNHHAHQMSSSLQQPPDKRMRLNGPVPQQNNPGHQQQQPVNMLNNSNLEQNQNFNQQQVKGF